MTTKRELLAQLGWDDKLIDAFQAADLDGPVFDAPTESWSRFSSDQTSLVVTIGESLPVPVVPHICFR